MGDRGADLSWLSMYPYEAEVCFPPCLGLEVMTTADGAPAKRCEGSVVVLELRPSVVSAFSAAGEQRGAGLPQGHWQWDLLPSCPPALRRLCCRYVEAPDRAASSMRDHMEKWTSTNSLPSIGEDAMPESPSAKGRWRLAKVRASALRSFAGGLFKRRPPSPVAERLPASQVSVLSSASSADTSLREATIVGVRHAASEDGIGVEIVPTSSEPPASNPMPEAERSEFLTSFANAYKARGTQGTA